MKTKQARKVLAVVFYTAVDIVIVIMWQKPPCVLNSVDLSSRCSATEI